MTTYIDSTFDSFNPTAEHSLSEGLQLGPSTDTRGEPIAREVDRVGTVPSDILMWLLVTAALLFASTVAAQEAQIEAASINFAQTHVLNADGDLGPNGGQQPRLVGNRDVLFKVNFVANQPGVGTGRLNAWLTLYGASGNRMSIALKDPSVLPILPTSFDDRPATVRHTFEDSHTAMIPAQWVKPGVRWSLNWVVHDTSGRITSTHIKRSEPLAIGPPHKAILTMIDVQWFEPQSPLQVFSENLFEEMEQKLPVSELEVRRPENNDVVFEKVAMPAQGSRLPQLVNSVADWNNNIGDGEVERSVRWASVLQKAAGKNYYEVSNFCVINHGSVAQGGEGADGYFCSSQRSKGVFWHEFGHTFMLRHWGIGTEYPYKDPDDYGDGASEVNGPINYDTYLGLSTGTRFHQSHVGPYWAFDSRDTSPRAPAFIAPWVDGDGDGTPNRWKASPMQGGGAVDSGSHFDLAHFSDYSINKINSILDDKATWFDADNEWIDDGDWSSHGAGWYFTNSSGYVPMNGDGSARPVGPDEDVYSVLIAGSMAQNGGAESFVHVYPTIGPYKSNVRTLYDPRTQLSELNAANVCPVGGCDLSMRVVQGGVTQIYALEIDWDTTKPYSDHTSFFERAINVPTSMGFVQSVEILSTPNVGVAGFNESAPVLVSRSFPEPVESGEEDTADDEEPDVPEFTLVPRPITQHFGATSPENLELFGYRSYQYSCPDNSVMSSITSYGNGEENRGLKFQCRQVLPGGTLGELFEPPGMNHRDTSGVGVQLGCHSDFMTGLHGSKSSEITSIGQVCSSRDDVMSGAVSWRTLSVGHREPEDALLPDSTCPAAHAVTGIRVYETIFENLQALVMSCSKIDLVEADPVVSQVPPTEHFGPTSPEHIELFGYRAASFSCPDNAVVSNIAVHSNSNDVDGMTFYCSNILADGTVGQPFASPESTFGDTSAPPVEVSCGADFMIGINGVKSTSAVARIGKSCAGIDAVFSGESAWTTTMVGSDATNTTLLPAASCPAEHVVTGISTYHTIFDNVQAMELSCTRVLPRSIEQHRTLRAATTECHASDVPGSHDCVNLAYRRDTAGMRASGLDEAEGWFDFAVDGFSNNDSNSAYLAKVGPDMDGKYRFTLDLGKSYENLEEIEIVSHDSARDGAKLVSVCYRNEGEANTCVDGQQINAEGSLIVPLSGSVTAQFVEVVGSETFAIDEILVLAADPFKEFRAPSFACGSTDPYSCSIDTFDKLVEAIEEYWGGDVDLIDTIPGLRSQSHVIEVTSVTNADTDGIDVAFDFVFDDDTRVSAKIMTLGSESGGVELVVVSDLPSSKQTWTSVLGGSLWPDSSTDSLAGNTKMVIPLAGTSGNDEDYGSFVTNKANGGKLWEALGIDFDTNLTIERGINLFTALSANALPESVKTVLSGDEIVFIGAVGFKSFDWFTTAHWAIPESFSLESIIPLSISVANSNSGLSLSQASAKFGIYRDELFVRFHAEGGISLHGAGPNIDASIIASFGEDSPSYTLEAGITEAWDSPFGFANASIPTAGVQYRSFGELSGLTTHGELQIAGVTDLNMQYQRTTVQIGGSPVTFSSASLDIKELSITSGALDSVLETVSGDNISLPSWLAGVEIKQLSGAVSWSDDSTKDYSFRADVAVCVDFDNHQVVEATSCTAAQLTEAELAINYVDDAFSYSVDVHFSDAFAHELIPEHYSPENLRLYVAEDSTGSEAQISGTLVRDSSQPNSHDVESLLFSLNVASGSSGSMAGGTFIYELNADKDCSGLAGILKTHGDTFDSHPGCNTQIPAETSGHHSTTGLSVSRFEVEFEAVTLVDGSDSYIAWISAAGKYDFANGKHDDLSAFVGMSNTGFVAGFDAQVEGNIADLVGMGEDLQGSSSPTGEQPISELSVLIASSGINGRLLDRVNDEIVDTPLNALTASTSEDFQLAISGQAPLKLREHLSFVGIHENLELEMHLDLSHREANFSMIASTYNCEYAPDASGCENFVDDSDTNDFPNWFKSAEVDLDFNITRKAVDDELRILLGGDWVIHENENPKAEDEVQDIELQAQLGFDTFLKEPAPTVFVCARLSSMNGSSGSLAKPSSLVSKSTCSLTNSDTSSYFPVHGIDKLLFKNLMVEIDLTPVSLSFEASGGIRVARGDGTFLDSNLDRLAFSINSETSAPMGGAVELSTFETISSAQMISFFNHHNSASATDLDLQNNDVGGNHLFHDIRMVGLINDTDVPDVGDENLGKTELAIEFGDLGNKFTFSSGFQIADGSGNYEKLGAVDLHLSLHEVHFYGDILLEPLLGEHFTKVEGGVSVSLEEEVRVDVNAAGLELSGSIEIPKPHLFGHLHLFGKHHKSFTNQDCVRSDATLNDSDDALTAYSKTVPTSNANCHHEHSSEIYSLRGNVSVNKDRVSAEGILDEFSCDLNGDGSPDTTCGLLSEKSVSMGIKKVHSVFGVTVGLPYIHVKSNNPIRRDSELDMYAQFYNRVISNTEIDFDGVGASELTYFNEEVLDNVVSQTFGDLDGDGKTDTLALVKILLSNGDTEFSLVYRLGSSTSWRNVSSSAIDFGHVESGSAGFGTLSFPNILPEQFDDADSIVQFSTVSQFQVGNVHPTKGDELLMRVGPSGRFQIVCQNVITTEPMCEVVADYIVDREVFLIDTNGDGQKSMVSSQIVSGSTLPNTFTVQWNGATGSWNGEDNLAANFPAIDFTASSSVGHVGTFEKNSKAEGLLLFNDLGYTYQWMLYQCERESAVAGCAEWSSASIKKSTDDPRGFYFGDFDGNSITDVLNLSSTTDADGMTSYNGELSSSARSHWKQGAEIDATVNSLWSASISGDIEHEDVSIACGSATSLGDREVITSGRSRNTRTLSHVVPTCASR